MSKITNDGLTRSGTGCFIAVPTYGNSGRQRVKARRFFLRELLLLSDYRSIIRYTLYMESPTVPVRVLGRCAAKLSL